MGEKRKQFSLEAVRLVEENGWSKARTAREFGIDKSLLKHWKTQMEGRSRAEAFPGPRRRRSGACAGRTSNCGRSGAS